MPAGRVPVKFSKELLEMYDEGYAKGFRDAMRMAYKDSSRAGSFMEAMEPVEYTGRGVTVQPSPLMRAIAKPKRKLSAWQKYIKNKRNHITYRDGKLNLKAMGVQYRKKKRR
jgi:hypothetical protein